MRYRLPHEERDLETSIIVNKKDLKTEMSFWKQCVGSYVQHGT